MSAITLQQIQDDPDRKDIFGLLNEYIQPGSTTSASRAALSFAQGVKKPDEAFFWRFWDDVFDVAAQIRHDHPAQDRLVAFARELALVPETGEKVWVSRVWTDLPLLGAAIRERLDKPPAPASTNQDQNHAPPQVSFHAFVARLLHAGVSPGSETTAIWMLRDALEQPQPGKGKGKDASSDRDLMIAAMYIEYAGATLVQTLALQPGPRLDESQRRILRGGELWAGESGLTAARWAFWGRRFRERAGEQATGQEAKDLALHAARLIEVWAQTRLAT